jgi:predicted double-glycine peptidase
VVHFGCDEVRSFTDEGRLLAHRWMAHIKGKRVTDLQPKEKIFVYRRGPVFWGALTGI